MSNDTTIKNAKNEVTICGWLKSMEWTEESDYIKGTITVLTGENNEVKVDCQANRYAYGTEDLNPTYKAVETIMESYISMASVMKNQDDSVSKEESIIIAKDKCTKLKFKASFSEYFSQKGFAYNSIKCKLPLSIKDGDEFKPSARFNVNFYLEEKTFETDKSTGEKTGRLILQAILPSFYAKGGAIKVPFVVPTSMAPTVSVRYEEKGTGFLEGDIVATVKERIVKEEGWGGKMRETVFHDVASEFVADFGSDTLTAEPSPKAFTTEAVKNAMAIRQEKIDKRTKKDKETSSWGDSNSTDGWA